MVGKRLYDKKKATKEMEILHRQNPSTHDVSSPTEKWELHGDSTKMRHNSPKNIKFGTPSKDKDFFSTPHSSKKKSIDVPMKIHEGGRVVLHSTTVSNNDIKMTM
jgi:hypothetical protein